MHITDDTMTLKIGGRVVATARFSEHAAANGNGAWIVSGHPTRLFTRDQAITALTVGELGEGGYPAATRSWSRSARNCDDRPAH
jgi:hypothetical protein